MDDSWDSIVAMATEAVRTLAAKEQTLALAESCTGGLVAAAVTACPGASEVLLEGLVVYSNEAKRRRLGVRCETLERQGAVSMGCVYELAAALREQSGATYAGAISGIAGPGGGTPDKPVGTVCFALAGPQGMMSRQELFVGDRHAVRVAAVRTLLSMILTAARQAGKDAIHGG